MKSDVLAIFDDLDQYRQFCVQFGRPYNERDLYNKSSGHYIDYLAFKEGKRIRNWWNINSGKKKPPYKKNFNNKRKQHA